MNKKFGNYPVTCTQTKKAENEFLNVQNSRNTSAEKLMDEAGLKIAEIIKYYYYKTDLNIKHHITLAVGKGHNTGDAYITAFHLAKLGWTFSELNAVNLKEQTPLTKKKRKKLLTKFKKQYIKNKNIPTNNTQICILDGLLGIGANLKKNGLRENYQKITKKINHLKTKNKSKIIAIDIPTGIDGDNGLVYPNAIKADITIAIAIPKTGLLADKATNNVGKITIAELPTLKKFILKKSKPKLKNNLITLSSSHYLKKIITNRNFDCHKGNVGKIGIIAGSQQYIGAACLTASAALKAGAGLVFLYVPNKILNIVSKKINPEIIVIGYDSLNEIETQTLDVITIGPGLGNENYKEIAQFITTLYSKFKGKIILDADALNALSSKPQKKYFDTLNNKNLNGKILITPHPKEFKRICNACKLNISNHTRQDQIQLFTNNYQHITILLKGTRTLIHKKNTDIIMNSTGNPGMATAGVGDVLSGIIASLAVKNTLLEASTLASWLNGKSAEIAIQNNESIQSLTASSIIKHLGKAFIELENGSY